MPPGPPFSPATGLVPAPRCIGSGTAGHAAAAAACPRQACWWCQGFGHLAIHCLQRPSLIYPVIPPLLRLLASPLGSGHGGGTILDGLTTGAVAALAATTRHASSLAQPCLDVARLLSHARPPGAPCLLCGRHGLVSGVCVVCDGDELCMGCHFVPLQPLSAAVIPCGLDLPLPQGRMVCLLCATGLGASSAQSARHLTFVRACTIMDNSQADGVVFPFRT